MLSLAACSACRREVSPESTDSGYWFKEVAEAVNIRFVHVPFTQQRYELPEIMGSGVCLIDYDGDGFFDVYFVQSGDRQTAAGANPGNRLFRNRGNGRFEDVTHAANVGDAGYGMGCTVGDYDADGDEDLYVTNVGSNVLYRNNGDGSFTDVTAAAGVGDPGWGTSCAFVDVDHDGHLDLFVTNYINWAPDRELNCRDLWGNRDYCHPIDYQAPAPDTLYRNNGDGTFTDVSRSAGLYAAFGNGLGVACADFNADGFTDIYVANDATANQLWISDGNGRFEDAALLSGCAFNGVGAAEGGMGVAVVDPDHDGDPDLFVTNFANETNTLYQNHRGMFDDVSAQSGLGTPSFPFTGFGLGFADFNHDGLLDLLVVNGRTARTRRPDDSEKGYREPNHLFRGTRNGFSRPDVPVRDPSGRLIASSRGAAFGDLDNDGAIDAVVVNFGAAALVYHNVAGGHGNWAMFRVRSHRGHDALGAWVKTVTGGISQMRIAQRAYSYCSSHDPRVHFGVGEADRIDEVVVRWPGGDSEHFGPFPVGTVHELVEGAGRRP